MGFVRYGGSPLLQSQPDGFHLVSLGVGDDPFDAAHSGRNFFQEIIFRREHHLGAGPVGKEFSAVRSQTGENILQGGDGRGSEIPFNLGGRINLLYCFFWGFAAVAWFKIFYPPVSRLIEKIPVKIGKIITWLLIIFMLADGIVSSAALARYNARSNGIEAENSFESWVDKHFDDERMAQVYPKAKKVG